ncbi:unnamed protein product [Lymnaea stagnalis]|uniref:C-type lectin domain-containing protein n=1 Tax=Lymnaea stagnalis TaxID=6523 RepID=A0AAV2IN47_LYMST
MPALKSVLLLLSMSHYVSVRCQGCSPIQENLNLFHRYEHSGKTYFMSKATYISDVASSAMCKTLCGYLAEIDDKDEHDFVVSINYKHYQYGILVAGTDKYKEGSWEYDRTLKSVKYFNWCLALGEPNNSNDQDCMGVSNKDACMLDHQCVYEYGKYDFHYLCEVD